MWRMWTVSYTQTQHWKDALHSSLKEVEVVYGKSHPVLETLPGTPEPGTRAKHFTFSRWIRKITRKFGCSSDSDSKACLFICLFDYARILPGSIDKPQTSELLLSSQSAEGVNLNWHTQPPASLHACHLFTGDLLSWLILWPLWKHLLEFCDRSPCWHSVLWGQKRKEVHDQREGTRTAILSLN